MPSHNTPLSKEDLGNAICDEINGQASDRQCYSYSIRFSAKAKKAEEAGDTKMQELFYLLSAVTELRLQVDSEENAFAPLFPLSKGQRSVAIEDIPEAHLDVLREVAPTISDPELRARVADVIWTRRPRDHEMAKIAVDAYLESAGALEHPGDWLAGRERAYRAIQLGIWLGSTGPYVQKVVAYIEDLIDRFVGKEPFLLPARMMDILLRYKQGNPSKYAPIAHDAATQAEAQHNWFIAQDYWNLEARWHALNNNEEEERAARIRAAETCVREAEMFAQGSRPDHISATVQIQRAIEAYRKVGNADERIEELRRILVDYQEKSMSEMQGYSVKLPDTGKVAEEAIGKVKGKSVEQALMGLALIYHPPEIEGLRSLAQKLKIDDLIPLFASTEIVDSKGRTVARKPDPIRDGEGKALKADMVGVARNHQRLATELLIVPTLNQISLEHYVPLQLMSAFVSSSPFVPPGREEIYARGLLAGFRGDFMIASHLLVAQIEESIRYLLTLNGAIPYGLDEDMVQDAFKLDKVLWMPETVEILGEEVVFDLKVLLVERFGANLRNRQYHGLMKAQEFEDWTPIYLWWLALHLCGWSLLESQIARKQTESQPEQSENIQ